MHRAEEAADLALNLRSGSLPAGVVYLEERTVGPSLGADSIKAGMVSGVAGVDSGCSGDAGLLQERHQRDAGAGAERSHSDAALSYFDAVLTLPGIAGIILTIGMAVDSNVLIFERIREELRGGKAVVAAVDAGFGKAFLDHHGYARNHRSFLRFPVPVRDCGR